ncbi:hypothetical protein LEN26_012309 [Aphanomyces euteiches]|nr:hypothetical protein AeMF1_021472 [Aphanomyces euteiches]KAH9117975.1 hypothetical protein LEN26_012309 [Aphanomyces euteiches]KAH9182457.1 hypothetical protein AeNC1_015569 [Aphanomyces euteiches]
METQDGSNLLAVEAQPTPFDFVVGQKKKQCLLLCNRSLGQDPIHFKIQCTESTRFRLHPSKGIVPPGQSLAVQIQLASHNTTEGQCVFLVLSNVRDGDKEVMLERQYIPCTIRSLDAPELSPPPREAPCRKTLVLLTKNMSRKPRNRLTPSDVDYLRREKACVPLEVWQDWERQAMALRRTMQDSKATRPLVMRPKSPKSECGSYATTNSASLSQLSKDERADIESNRPPNACIDEGCMWTRYMLDVCTQHLDHTVGVCDEMLKTSKKPHDKLIALKTSTQTLRRLLDTNPFLWYDRAASSGHRYDERRQPHVCTVLSDEEEERAHCQ